MIQLGPEQVSWACFHLHPSFAARCQAWSYLEHPWMKLATAWWKTLCTATSVALWLHALMPKWQGFSELPGVSVLKQKPLFVPVPAISQKPMVTVLFSRPAHVKQTSLIFQSLFSGLLLGCETSVCVCHSPGQEEQNGHAALCIQHPALAQPFFGTASYCWLQFMADTPSCFSAVLLPGHLVPIFSLCFWFLPLKCSTLHFFFTESLIFSNLATSFWILSPSAKLFASSPS